MSKATLNDYFISVAITNFAGLHVRLILTTAYTYLKLNLICRKNFRPDFITNFPV